MIEKEKVKGCEGKGWEYMREWESVRDLTIVFDRNDTEWDEDVFINGSAITIRDERVLRTVKDHNKVPYRGGNALFLSQYSAKASHFN